MTRDELQIVARSAIWEKRRQGCLSAIAAEIALFRAMRGGVIPACEDREQNCRAIRRIVTAMKGLRA